MGRMCILKIKRIACRIFNDCLLCAMFSCMCVKSKNENKLNAFDENQIRKLKKRRTIKEPEPNSKGVVFSHHLFHFIYFFVCLLFFPSFLLILIMFMYGT